MQQSRVMNKTRQKTSRKGSEVAPKAIVLELVREAKTGKVSRKTMSRIVMAQVHSEFMEEISPGDKCVAS